MAKSLIAGLVTLCLALCILCATAEENLIPWEYEVPLKDLQSGYLTVNNKERLLDEDTDDPADLVRLTVQCTSSSAVLLRQSAGDALGRMFTVARRQGIELYANSGFRNYTTQKTMYRNRMERLGRDDGVVAYPGSCDNQTGLGVDVISKEWIGKQVDETFAETPEAKWMAENCWKYGFVIRYPADKTELTFSGYQPWHLRYVAAMWPPTCTRRITAWKSLTPNGRRSWLSLWKPAAISKRPSRRPSCPTARSSCLMKWVPTATLK